jgi:hypothetical protein
MDKKTFSALLLLSALPLLAYGGGLSLDRADFTSAKTVQREGRTLVRVKLSKAGKAKLRKLNKNAVGEPVHAEIAGVATDFRLREPIRGEGLEMGPYEGGDAAKVVSAINGK